MPPSVCAFCLFHLSPLRCDASTDVIVNVRPNVDYNNQKMDHRLATLCDLMVLDITGAQLIVQSAPAGKGRPAAELKQLGPFDLVREVQHVCTDTARGGMTPTVILKPQRPNAPVANAHDTILVAEPSGACWLFKPKVPSSAKVGGMDSFVGGLATAMALGEDLRSSILWGDGLAMLQAEAGSLEDLARAGRGICCADTSSGTSEAWLHG